ncbi:MAG: hypothetical protein H6686_07175 [Fibrobacteria bacterium]|nr:hypothetical protein [Fibrobacteria bacterium]
MPLDGANMQGANVRQVVVQADVAIQANLGRRDAPGVESHVRPLAHLAERLQAEKNQNVGTDLFVERQEDNQKYSAGDALNGHGKQDARKQRRKPKTEGEEDSSPDETDEQEEGSAAWSVLGDPREAQTRLLKALADLEARDASSVFIGLDRHILSGLLLPTGKPSGAVQAYQKQTMQVQAAAEAFRAAVHGAQQAVEAYSSGHDDADRERARKLVSLARQGVDASSKVGVELAAFLDEALLEVSRPEESGLLRAVGLLAVVESAISLWREGHNVGTVLPWSLR